jgi:hypothetical protein
MAAKKSVSRKSAAKKAPKKAAKKTAKKTAKPRTKAPVRPVTSPAIAEIDVRIAIIRNNLRALVEQAASYSGAGDDERMSQRITEQETKLELLKKQRDELVAALPR